MPTTDLPIPGADDHPAEETVARQARDTIQADALTASLSAIGTASAESMSTAGTAIATAKTGSLDATGSAILLAQADGDVSIQLSAAPIVSAKGDATFRQSYASAFIAGGQVDVSQGGAPLMVSRQINIETGGACAIVASEATVRKGWIGLLLARKADVSEDSRVLLDTRGALIIAAALLGGFGLVAVAAYLSAQRLAQWRPTLPSLKRR